MVSAAFVSGDVQQSRPRSSVSESGWKVISIIDRVHHMDIYTAKKISGLVNEQLIKADTAVMQASASKSNIGKPVPIYDYSSGNYNLVWIFKNLNLFPKATHNLWEILSEHN